MAHVFSQPGIACFLTAVLVAQVASAADTAVNVRVAKTNTFTASAVETSADSPLLATGQPDPARANAARAELELFAAEINQLFPPSGVWLSLSYSRPGFEQFRIEQAQKFTSNFHKTPEGNFEKPGFCETEWFKNGKSSIRIIETTIHRLTVENDRVVLYAIHAEVGGGRNVYGPSPVAREGNALVFRDINPAMVPGGNWIQSTFYRKRDGTLGSTRHWNAPYVDVWITQDPPSTTQ